MSLTGTLMKQTKGFTLVELLIALLISSFVIMGSYSLMDASINAKSFWSNKQEYQTIYKSLYKLINEDIISTSSRNINVSKDSMSDSDLVNFETQNSLYFNQSMPVRITYFTEDGYLIRREEHNILQNPLEIKLISGVKEFNVKGYDGDEFSERNFDTKLLKFNIKINGKDYEIITGAF